MARPSSRTPRPPSLARAGLALLGLGGLLLAAHVGARQAPADSPAITRVADIRERLRAQDAARLAERPAEALHAEAEPPIAQWYNWPNWANWANWNNWNNWNNWLKWGKF